MRNVSMRESTHGPRGIGQEVAAGGEVHALTREDVEECFVQQGGGTQRQGGKVAAQFSFRKAVQLAIQVHILKNFGAVSLPSSHLRC